MKTLLAGSILLLAMPGAFAAVADVSAESEEASALETVLNEELIMALRDPFELPSSRGSPGKDKGPELTLFPINDLKLNGVITGPKKLRALISAPNGKTFFVRVGDLIGLRSGKITQIRSDAVTIVETEEVKGKRVSGAVELRIGGEMVSLSGRKGED
jgi:hypothetical protein